MTLPQIISRNQIQKTNKRMIPFTNDVVQPTTWYTCPTGKVAIVRGSCACADTGAAANADLIINGVVYARWIASGGDTNRNGVLNNLLEALSIDFVAYLNAGDTIVTDQDSGTNAQFHFEAEIEEFII